MSKPWPAGTLVELKEPRSVFFEDDKGVRTSRVPMARGARAIYCGFRGSYEWLLHLDHNNQRSPWNDASTLWRVVETPDA